MAVRGDRPFKVTEQSGVRRTFRLVDYATIDDAVSVMQGAIAAEYRADLAYTEGMFPRSFKDQLLRVRTRSGIEQ